MRSADGHVSSGSRPYTLAIEGATYRGSVALLRGSEVVCERELSGEDAGGARAGRGERLMPAIAECFAEAGLKGDAIRRIVCGAGPGSFTSLRIAGSVAKGLAVGYGVPLFAVSSLLLGVSGAKPPLPPGDYLSVLDAMRDEFFASRIVYRPDGGEYSAEPARILSRLDLDEFRAREKSVRVVGPGQEIDAHPHARGVAPVLDQVLKSEPVDLAGWEPDYGRLAEAQVRWEAVHGRPLTA
ncbi:MAG TPA: tRNA (adenosine(37)-N6)-threonylcarbamoyltransferase complex dimerization subunit type 1 TsaB [Gemmatimonadaceae bacterium]|nr:tRNA (adenosine(37)-N6)-threonylcarbamoyltransferase complex dimerization subunit type 1 TsaB [Gemmatimonadaceae bacterium]